MCRTTIVASQLHGSEAIRTDPFDTLGSSTVWTSLDLAQFLVQSSDFFSCLPLVIQTELLKYEEKVTTSYVI